MAKATAKSPAEEPTRINLAFQNNILNIIIMRKNLFNSNKFYRPFS
jgi:hypothetical protein